MYIKILLKLIGAGIKLHFKNLPVVSDMIDLRGSIVHFFDLYNDFSFSN